MKSSESSLSSAKSATAGSRRRENGTSSDGSKYSSRVNRVSSRERMSHQSNASSSEDLPNSSVEVPRRPRRTKVVKHHEDSSSSKKTSSASIGRSSKPTESSLRRSAVKAESSSISKGEMSCDFIVKSTNQAWLQFLPANRDFGHQSTDHHQQRQHQQRMYLNMNMPRKQSWYRHAAKTIDDAKSWGETLHWNPEIQRTNDHKSKNDNKRAEHN